MVSDVIGQAGPETAKEEQNWTRWSACLVLGEGVAGRRGQHNYLFVGHISDPRKAARDSRTGHQICGGKTSY